jgi:hypothetical protein
MSPHSCIRTLTISCAAIATVIITSVSQAAVPAAAIEVSAEGGTTILTTGTVTGTGCNGDMGCESTASTADANLSVSTKGTTSGSNPANASGGANIAVYYEIVGPVSGTQVPLVISGSASTSAEGPDAEGLAYIYYNDGALYTCSSTIVGPCGTEPSSGSLNAVVFTNNYSGSLYDLEVIVSGSSSLGTGKFSARISKVTLAIEPTWLANNPGYRLKFSKGIRVSKGSANCSQDEGADVVVNCSVAP